MRKFKKFLIEKQDQARGNEAHEPREARPYLLSPLLILWLLEMLREEALSSRGCKMGGSVTRLHPKGLR